MHRAGFFRKSGVAAIRHGPDVNGPKTGKYMN